MGTALLLQHSTFSYRRSSSSITTSLVGNHPTSLLHLPHQNVLLQQQQPMNFLPLKRITSKSPTNPFRSKFNHTKLFCSINISNTDNSSFRDAMADNSDSVSGNSTTLNGKIKDEKELEKSTPPPPPPEKPLPDDCCGSGCVRCVWDIYYEELEAYNKLYKISPDSSSKKS